MGTTEPTLSKGVIFYGTERQVFKFSTKLLTILESQKNDQHNTKVDDVDFNKKIVSREVDEMVVE
jgi:hypothetical protein